MDNQKEVQERITRLKEEKVKIKERLSYVKGAVRNPFFPSSFDVKMWDTHGLRWPDKKYNLIRPNPDEFVKDIEKWKAFYEWILENTANAIEWEEIQIHKESPRESDYGYHQRNDEWIHSMFHKLKGECPSQNKTVIKVIELYREEFGLSIGKSTILRAAKVYE